MGMHTTASFHQYHFFTLSISSGIGYATQVVIAYAAVSYIVIQAWAFFYLFSSFSADIPWASCRNSWNTGTCLDRQPTEIHHGCDINLFDIWNNMKDTEIY